MEKQVKLGSRDFYREIHYFLFVKHNLFQWLEQQMLLKTLSQIYFDKLSFSYAKLNIIAKPMLLYNVDESGVTVVTKPTGVVTQVR